MKYRVILESKAFLSDPELNQEIEWMLRDYESRSGVVMEIVEAHNMEGFRIDVTDPRHTAALEQAINEVNPYAEGWADE